MADLQTTYMGIPLENPVIAGACTLTGDISSIRMIEEAGAGAVVARSLFEEQVQLNHLSENHDPESIERQYAEIVASAHAVQPEEPAQHLVWLRQVKECVGIPVIGSLNAVTMETWLEYGRQMEDTGIDGLECNFYAFPEYSSDDGEAIVNEQVKIVEMLSSALSLPLSIKLSLSYSNPLSAIRRMDEAGATGFVLFNRLFDSDIDLQKEELVTPVNISSEIDYMQPLRHAGLLYGTIDAGICCSRGIFEGDEIIKMILAGADSVQVVSALYAHGIRHISKMLRDVNLWMERKGYGSLSEFRGKLSRERKIGRWSLTREQYASLMMNPPELKGEPGHPPLDIGHRHGRGSGLRKAG